jgi:hypothetical protein
VSTQLVADDTDHAEVDQCDGAVAMDEQVPRVEVGVEEALLEDHLEHDVRAMSGNEVAV